MQNDLILAIDLGTQSLRAMLFDNTGQLILKRATKMHYQRPDALTVEIDATIFWQKLTEVCQALWADDAALKKRVAAVTLTTQRASVVALDMAAEPVVPAIIWMDKRRVEKAHIPTLGFWWETAFKLAGVTETVRGFQADCEIAWIKTYRPEAYAKIHRYGLVSSYLNWQLSGQWHDSVASQVGYLPFDFKKQQWAKRHDWRWLACPAKLEWLPKLFKPGECLGQVTEQASAQTGIPAGLPIIASGADKACEVLGSGCLTPDIACLSYGTTATVNLSLDHHIHPLPFVPSYPAAATDFFNAEYQIYRGYWMVSWFKEQFGHLEQQRADEVGGVPEQFFDELVQKVPPGAEGLILQPYWSPGVREPGPEARGAVIGWADHHTRAHLYRAILEGIAYGLRQGLENLEKRAHTKIRVLRVSGGGSQSDAAMQLTADIFNRPAERLREYETSGLGAAMNAAVYLRWYKSYPEAIKAMTHVAQRFEPRTDTASMYNQLYRKVYLSLYKRLKPLYRQLSQVRH